MVKFDRKIRATEWKSVAYSDEIGKRRLFEKRRRNDKEDAGWESKSEQSVKKTTRCVLKRERIRLCLDGLFWHLPLSPSRVPVVPSIPFSAPFPALLFLIIYCHMPFLPVDPLFIDFTVKVFRFSTNLLS